MPSSTQSTCSPPTDSLSITSAGSSLGLFDTIFPCSSNLSNLQPLIDSVRFLAADTVLNAGSGHTGMPMGMAPAASILWNSHMRFVPNNPSFINRDRFILSAGHGSTLLYSLLHVFGVKDSISLSDLKSFRTYPSVAPGHPENKLTPGVEVTSGALGQGIANAVGFALAESHLRSVYGKEEFSPIDHFTFCVVGDGCLMEGVSSEVCSLAGHWKLGRLIVLYDDNSISIEGSTDLAFTEDVTGRFQSANWQVLTVDNGNTDFVAIDQAISLAKVETDKPTLIRIKTTIGYGTSLAGTAKIHGPCLDKEIVDGAKEELGWNHPSFFIPDDVKEMSALKKEEGDSIEKEWNDNFSNYRSKYPDLANEFEQFVVKNELPASTEEILDNAAAKITDEPLPTRKTSGEILNALANAIPSLIGGSADLAPSTNTNLKKFDDMQFDSMFGRNIHFGVREHGMGSICNGMALHGSGLIPFCSTFLVFTDYMRAAIRTAALAEARVIFIMTHDSVLLGQDGPTHQPVEHLASLRAMPNVLTIRPAGPIETAAAYEIALNRKSGPTVLALSRQPFSIPKGLAKKDGALMGGYVFEEDDTVDGIIISTGSEVCIVAEAATELRGKGYGVRVVSMPCVELFLTQSKKYRREIMGNIGRNRILVVEAGSSWGWHRFADHVMSVDTFGISAAADQVAASFQLTAPDVVNRFEEMLCCDHSNDMF